MKNTLLMTGLKNTENIVVIVSTTMIAYYSNLRNVDWFPEENNFIINDCCAKLVLQNMTKHDYFIEEIIYTDHDAA